MSASNQFHVNVVRHRGSGTRETVAGRGAAICRQPGERCPYCGNRLVKTMELLLHLEQVKECRKKHLTTPSKRAIELIELQSQKANRKPRRKAVAS